MAGLGAEGFFVMPKDSMCPVFGHAWKVCIQEAVEHSESYASRSRHSFSPWAAMARSRGRPGPTGPFFEVFRAAPGAVPG